MPFDSVMRPGAITEELALAAHRKRKIENSNLLPVGATGAAVIEQNKTKTIRSVDGTENWKMRPQWS